MNKTWMIKIVERIGRPLWIAGGGILLCCVGILDYLTGYELSFSLFYLIPLAILTWVTSGRIGVLISFVSAIVWFAADVASGAKYSNPAIPYWNTGIRLGFFLLTVLLLKIGKELESEKIISHTDYLTGAVNSRYFNEVMQMEINRSSRTKHPITIAFIDIDDFKTINDQFGHSVGDRVLESVAATMRQRLRRTDIVARVGGDEFAILLPEVGPETAQIVISKMKNALLDEMRANHWTVTFSIGVITFLDPPESADEALNMADQIMYSVKNNGKNNVSHVIHSRWQMSKPNAKEEMCL